MQLNGTRPGTEQTTKAVAFGCAGLLLLVGVASVVVAFGVTWSLVR